MAKTCSFRTFLFRFLARAVFAPGWFQRLFAEWRGASGRPFADAAQGLEFTVQ
jgi:hypothetical protein